MVGKMNLKVKSIQMSAVLKVGLNIAIYLGIKKKSVTFCEIYSSLSVKPIWIFWKSPLS